MNSSDTSSTILNILENLISCKSITPDHAGSFDYLESLLKPYNFTVIRKKFGLTENIYCYYGSGKTNFCFLGHVDVVPSGSLSLWSANPFKMTIKDNKVYGRGAVDMKGAIASFFAAVINFFQTHNHINNTISILLTSNEEGDGAGGIEAMLEWLYQNNHKIDLCLTGEPTSEEYIGDTIKVGRRGSVNYRLTVFGTQGHAAYPDKAINPNNLMIEILYHLKSLVFNKTSKFFDKTTLTITSIDIKNNITNLIPEKACSMFNIRYNDSYTHIELTDILNNVISSVSKNYKLEETLSAKPFINKEESLANEFLSITEATTLKKCKFSTSGGTSDARFIYNHSPVIELGLLNNTAHKIDEFTKISDLQTLYNVYYKALNKFLL